MNIGPIWRAMMHNKAGFVLIALQIAVTLTIMVNAVGIIQERSGMMDRPSGLDEANTFAFASVLFSDYEREQRKVLIDEDLDLIRNTPGVVNAVASNSFPLRQGGWSMSLALEPGNQTPEFVSSAKRGVHSGVWLRLMAMRMRSGAGESPCTSSTPSAPGSSASCRTTSSSSSVSARPWRTRNR